MLNNLIEAFQWHEYLSIEQYSIAKCDIKPKPCNFHMLSPRY